MDMSKLPKLSETPKPPDNSTPPPTMQGEAFFSIAMGVLLLLLYPRLLHWLFRPSTFAPFIDPSTGATVPYPSTPAFWMDLGPVLFGAILVLEGLVIAFVRKPA